MARKPASNGAKTETSAAPKSRAASKATSFTGSNNALNGYVGRLERLETARREAAADMSEVLNEAEAAGFHKRALRQIVKRRLETDEQEATRLATEESFDAMMASLGMLGDTPLGQAAAASHHMSN